MNTGELFNVQDYGVIVTGGASGLGLGYTEALARHGAAVTILDIDQGSIDQVVGELSDRGLIVRGEVVDVTDHEALDQAFVEAVAAHGRLDVVFANAGVDAGPGFLGAWSGDELPRHPDGAIEDYTDARWNRVIDVNLNGVFATVRAAARHLRPQKSGRIIVTTSVAATKIEPAVGAAYMAAKAATAHFTRNIALELAADNITVNAIAPGFFVTNIGGGHAKAKEVQDAMSAVIPMHRVGFPNDMAGLALFLGAPASDYMLPSCA